MDKNTYIGLQVVNMGFDAHLTLIFTGELTKKKEELYLSILDEVVGRKKFSVFNLDRRSIEMFGPNHDVPVLRLEPHIILNDLRNALMDCGVVNKGYTEWNPHVTLKFDGKSIDKTIELPPRVRCTGLTLYK